MVKKKDKKTTPHTHAKKCMLCLVKKCIVSTLLKTFSKVQIKKIVINKWPEFLRVKLDIV